ncbi:MAG: GGDEF domain-containing protein [Planctomycetota bacterium]
MASSLQERIEARRAEALGPRPVVDRTDTRSRIRERVRSRIGERTAEFKTRQLIDSGAIQTEEGFGEAVRSQLEARRARLGRKLSPQEMQATLHAVQQLAGREVTGTFGFDEQGRAVAGNPFVEAVNAQNQANPFRDFSQGALRNLNRVGSDLVGIVNPEYAQELEANAAAMFGTEGGVAGGAGEIGGEVLKLFALGGAGKLAGLGRAGQVGLFGGAFGAQGFGGSRVESADARDRGLEVSVADEFLAAGLTGTAEGASGALTAFLGGLGGQALKRLAPQLVVAFRSGGQQGVAQVIRTLGLPVAASGGEAAEEAVTQLVTNAISQTFIDPDKDLTEGLAQSAAQGAIVSPIAQVLLGGLVEVGRQRTRGTDVQDTSKVDPTAADPSAAVRSEPPPETQRPEVTDGSSAAPQTESQPDADPQAGNLTRQLREVVREVEAEADRPQRENHARQLQYVRREVEDRARSQAFGRQVQELVEESRIRLDAEESSQGRIDEIAGELTALRAQRKNDETLTPGRKGAISRRIRSLENERARLRRQQRTQRTAPAPAPAPGSRRPRPDDTAEVLELRGQLDEAQRQANTDARTGAPNFRRLRNESERAFERADRDHKPVAVLKMDLSNFKALNDTKGEAEGDRALKVVLDTLAANTRRGTGRGQDVAVAARIGGDENGVLIEGANPEQAAAAARRLEAAVNRALADAGLGRVETSSGGGGRTVEASFGVAVREPGSGESFADVLQRADSQQKAVATQRKQERAARGEATARFDKADEAAAFVSPTTSRNPDRRNQPPTPREQNLVRETKRVMADPGRRDGFGASFAQAILGVGTRSRVSAASILGGSLIDVSAPLQKFGRGRQWVEILDHAEQARADLAGPLRLRLDNVIRNAPLDARRWLHEVRPDGFTNAQAAVEAHLFTDNPLAKAPEGTAEIVSVLREIQDVTGDAAEAAHVKLRNAGRGRGAKADGQGAFKKAKDGRYFRQYTPEGRQMLEFRSGPEWDALVDWLQAHPELNPDLDVSSEAAIRRHLERDELTRPGRPGSSGKVRRDRALTQRRAFRGLPAYLSVNGKRVALIETNVPNLYERAIESQTREISLYRAMTDFVDTHRPFRIPTEKDGDGAVNVDIDSLTDRLRKYVAEGAGQDGRRPDEAAKAFDETLDAFTNNFGTDLTGEVFFNDPTGIGSRVGSAVFRNLRASMLSLSGLYDVAQPLTAADVTGIGNVAKAYQQVVRDFANGRGLLAEYRALDAVPQTLIWLSGERGSLVEESAKFFERTLPNALIAPSGKAEVMSQTVTAHAFRLYADRINPGKLPAAHRKMLQGELRLTEGEIATIEAEGVTDAIRNKIIRNGVKRTNFLAEDSHRRGRVQNMPVFRFFVPFQSVAAGRLRAFNRSWGRVQELTPRAIQGDREALKELVPIVSSFLMLMGVAFGQGAFQKYLRRAVTGQPLVRPDDPDFLSSEWLTSTAQDAALFGLWGHVFNSFDYAQGRPEKLLANAMPQLSVLTETLTALAGWGKYKHTPIGERLVGTAEGVNPVVRGLHRWIDSIAYPERKNFNRARSLVRAWEKDNDIERPRAFAESTPSSALRRDIFELIRDDADPEAIQDAIDAYFTFEAEQGTDRDKAYRSLRASLTNMNNRPVNLNNEQTAQFLSRLSDEDRRFVVETQQRYHRTVNQWVPSRR